MNLQIINGCVATDMGLPTVGTDPCRRYSKNKNIYRYIILENIIGSQKDIANMKKRNMAKNLF